MYSLTIRDGMHSGGTKFYRVVVATGPESSVAIFQWGPGRLPATTAAAPSRRSSLFQRGVGAVAEAQKKLNEKERLHAGGKYLFVTRGAPTRATLGELVRTPEFEVLCDEDKARVLTSLAEPLIAEMEGMERFTLDEIRHRLVTLHGIDDLMPTPSAPVAPTAAAQGERYGDDKRWGAW